MPIPEKSKGGTWFQVSEYQDSAEDKSKFEKYCEEVKKILPPEAPIQAIKMLAATKAESAEILTDIDRSYSVGTPGTSSWGFNQVYIQHWEKYVKPYLTEEHDILVFATVFSWQGHLPKVWTGFGHMNHIYNFAYEFVRDFWKDYDPNKPAKSQPKKRAGRIYSFLEQY